MDLSHCKDCRGHLQKIAVVETKTSRLEDSVNNTTLPWSPNTKLTLAQAPCSTNTAGGPSSETALAQKTISCLPEKQDASTAKNDCSMNNTTIPWTPIAKLTLAKPCPGLIDTAKLTLAQDTANESSEAAMAINSVPRTQAVSDDTACWNAPGTKPKNKSIRHKIVIPEAAESASERPEISTATGWPALLPSQQFISTPVANKEQPWIVREGKNKSNSPQPAMTLKLDNRFQPLGATPNHHLTTWLTYHLHAAQ